MPSKIKQIRLSYDDSWDIIYRRYYEFIVNEKRWYNYKHIIMYTPIDCSFPKVRTL
jgi:hypothetical protein